MRESLKGKVIRIHGDNGHTDLGRIIYDYVENDDVLYIAFPSSPEKAFGEVNSTAGAKVPKNEKRKSAYLGMPRRLRRATIPLLGGGKSVSLVDFTPPAEWLLPDDQLKKEATSLEKNRRNLPQWLKHREQQKELIEPITSEFGEFELLELGLLQELVHARSKTLGYATTKKVRQTVLRFLLGCGHPNALLPNWGEIGGKGTDKFTKKKTGAPSRRRSLPHAAPEHVSDEHDRRKLKEGYRKHKRKRVSNHVAYLRTMEEYWPGNEAVVHRSERKYFLLPANQRPTEAAFRWAARSLRSASRINMGELVHRAVKRALMGSRADGVVAVGQLGVIDCTSEDQTLVSAVNCLKVLPSSNRTLVVDVKSEYILGIYCGFEHPSTLTSLLAILNCAADKVSFCAQHGVYISVGDWHSRVPKRIRADNGELKSEQGIKTMTASEVGLEFVRSYAGDMKSLVEATHLMMHRHFDHHVAGSTQGRAKERGEPAREEEACRTFEQNMKYVIEAVLYINNEQPVPQLLTVEMRKDGVQPTRRSIYEWCVDKGYVTSEPIDMDTLRAHCLPKLKAVIHRDGIHVFDPRDERRLIPGLVYVGAWLAESGLCERATRGRIPCELQLDPQNISEAFVTREGLRELSLKTTDPLVKELTLFEYLQMTDEDKDVVDAMQSDQESRDAFFHSSNQDANKAAKAAKAQALAEAGNAKPSRGAGYEKRKNLDDELSRRRLNSLGLGDFGAQSHSRPPDQLIYIDSVRVPALGQFGPKPQPGLPRGQHGGQTETDRDLHSSPVREIAQSITGDLMAQIRKTRRG
jgi:hypothetical protein